MIGKIQEIIDGWKNYIFPTEEMEKVAKERLEICVACPKMDKEKDRCTICHCYISAKVRSSTSFCPMKKWHKLVPKNDKK